MAIDDPKRVVDSDTTRTKDASVGSTTSNPDTAPTARNTNAVTATTANTNHPNRNNSVQVTTTAAATTSTATNESGKATTPPSATMIDSKDEVKTKASAATPQSNDASATIGGKRATASSVVQKAKGSSNEGTAKATSSSPLASNLQTIVHANRNKNSSLVGDKATDGTGSDIRAGESSASNQVSEKHMHKTGPVMPTTAAATLAAPSVANNGKLPSSAGTTQGPSSNPSNQQSSNSTKSNRTFVSNVATASQPATKITAALSSSTSSSSSPSERVPATTAATSTTSTPTATTGPSGPHPSSAAASSRPSLVTSSSSNHPRPQTPSTRPLPAVGGAQPPVSHSKQPHPSKQPANPPASAAAVAAASAMAVTANKETTNKLVNGVFLLLETYGPLTLDQLSFNLPPLPATSTTATTLQSAKAVVGNTSNRLVVRDILQMLVALGLVQQEDTSIIPAAGSKPAPATSPSPASSAGPVATSRPPRYCINEGRPRETAPLTGTTYNVITPTNVLAEIRKAEAEIVATHQRIHWLSEALGAPNTTPPESASATTTTTTTARSNKEGKKKHAVRVGSIAAAGETLKQIVLRYPDMAYDPLYVTALRNLQVDSLLIDGNNSNNNKSSGSGGATNGKEGTGSSLAGRRNNNATGKRKRKPSDKTATTAANKKVPRLSLSIASATTVSTSPVPTVASQDRIRATTASTIAAGVIGKGSPPDTGHVDAKRVTPQVGVNAISGHIPAPSLSAHSVKATASHSVVMGSASETTMGTLNPDAPSRHNSGNVSNTIATAKQPTKYQPVVSRKPGISKSGDAGQSSSTTEATQCGTRARAELSAVASLPSAAPALEHANKTGISIADEPKPVPAAGRKMPVATDTESQTKKQNETEVKREVG